MHPHYIADEMGTCPICGMDLVKRASVTKTDKTPDTPADQAPLITIEPQIIQNMGVRTEKAKHSHFGRQIKSFGIIKENERLSSELSARVEGWIEKLNITAVGDEVKPDDILYELFSPELLVSQRDYLTARRQGMKARDNITRRLTSFGVQQKALSLLDKTNEVQQNLPFFSERTGTISELNVTKGSYVKRGMTIAKIQDYSSLWIIAKVPEIDLPFITLQSKAEVSFPNHSAQKLSATVDYIYPDIDPKTRTGQVRVLVENKSGSLRPGMYVDILFETNKKHRLSIPSEAILRDKDGDRVIISLGKGGFRSRKITTGLVSASKTEVISGMSAGEDVVVSAQFLIDSESSFKEAFRKLEPIQKPLSLLKPSKTQLAMLDHLVDAALYIHETLTTDKTITGEYLTPALSAIPQLQSNYENTKLAPILISAEKALKSAQAANTKLKLQAALKALTSSLLPWITNGAPEHYTKNNIKIFTDKPSAANWLQLISSPMQRPKNPYGSAAALPFSFSIKSMIESPAPHADEKRLIKKDQTKHLEQIPSHQHH
ncbi:MAG: hypothetical protein DHS20C08_06260 [Rhodomicrobium sp.]|nr:MAG: hypothetical protein DHS20C08_06260 [Rhodomicrobium sp.]